MKGYRVRGAGGREHWAFSLIDKIPKICITTLYNINENFKYEFSKILSSLRLTFK